MKTTFFFRKSETLEDIVFEGRNKAYGAFELNRKERKYLLIAFLICFTGVSTTIAVPFLHSLNSPLSAIPVDKNVQVKITDLDPNKPDLPLPPPMPDISEKLVPISYKVPEFVEEGDTNIILVPNTELINKIENPVPDKIIPTSDNSGQAIVKEPEEEIILFPSEPAFFNGCSDLSCFHQWVSENIKYPDIAAESEIFGKVIIQFCVNSKGEVVDVQVVRKLDPAIDEATVKLIKSSPRWTPAKQGGNPVKTLFTISFTFKLV